MDSFWLVQFSKNLSVLDGKFLVGSVFEKSFCFGWKVFGWFSFRKIFLFWMESFWLVQFSKNLSVLHG